MVTAVVWEAVPGCPGGAGMQHLPACPCSLLREAAPAPAEHTDGPNNLDGKHRLRALELVCSPNYFQASREPRLLKNPSWLKKVSVGRAVFRPSASQPGAYGTERWLGSDIRLGFCKSLLRDH